MTFHVRHILGLLQAHAQKPVTYLRGVFFNQRTWPLPLQLLYDYLIGCHVAHVLEYLVALAFYAWLWPSTFALAHTLAPGWIITVFAFNLACMVICCGFWHWMMYQSPIATGPARKLKFNPSNQYEPWGTPVGFVSSSSGQLTREVTFTTLGWLQSSVWQVVFMHLWATGAIPYCADFWSTPVYSILHLLFPTYWRLFHFYWVHRLMHPWWPESKSPYDVGAFLYKMVHSLHHKSYNPGPWAGLAMHPVEHLVYYTCLLPYLFLPVHPLAFLYNKFHADISPIGGHDGFPVPGGGSDYHYLHHAHFECNYGVPLINFDKLFGTWVGYDHYLAADRKFAKAKELARSTHGLRGLVAGCFTRASAVDKSE